MCRSTVRRILASCLLCTLAGCHSLDYHRRPRSDDRPDPNYGMTSIPVGSSFTERIAPNWLFDWIYEGAHRVQSLDR